MQLSIFANFQVKKSTPEKFFPKLHLFKREFMSSSFETFNFIIFCLAIWILHLDESYIHILPLKARAQRLCAAPRARTDFPSRPGLMEVGLFSWNLDHLCIHIDILLILIKLDRNPNAYNVCHKYVHYLYWTYIREEKTTIKCRELQMKISLLRLCNSMAWANFFP